MGAAQAIRAYFTDYGYAGTQHSVGNIRIAFTGADTAISTSQIPCYHWLADARMLLAPVRYRDEFLRADGMWRIARRDIFAMRFWSVPGYAPIRGRSDRLRFTHAFVRQFDASRPFADSRGLTLLPAFDDVLAHPGIDAVMQSASIPPCLASPATIASKQDRWRSPAATRKGVWNGRYVLFGTDFLPPVSSKISAI